MSRAKRFMECVWNLTPPVVLDPVIKITAVKEYDMVGDNLWASAAKDFLDHKSAAEMFKNAETRLRERVPNDASIATGYGVTARRDKALRLSIRANDEPRKKR